MRFALYAGAAVLALFPAAAYADGPNTDTDTDQAKSTDIIVTASPFGIGAGDTPTISSKVDRQQILTSGGASIADSLKDVPGIAASGFAAGASRPIIRGMDATRVRLLENGLSSSDVSDIGPDHGTPIDPLSARDIEIVRGAATLRYGSQAIGGVVNATNNRVPTLLPTNDLSGEVTGSFDSVSNTGQGSVLGDGRVGNLAVHVDGFYRNAGDYGTPLGTQVNSFFHGFGQAVGASYFFNGDEDHVGAAIQRYDAQYGIPSDDTYIDLRQVKVLTRSSFSLGSGLFKKFTFDGSYGDYTHNEKEQDGTILSTFKNQEYDAHAELILNPLGPIENTAVGVEYQNRKFSALGDGLTYLLPTLTSSIAGYVFTDIPLTDQLRVQASGRIESVHMQGTPISGVFTKRDFTPISGSVGALYTPVEGIKLGINFASTGRAPAITELFARGGHDGPQTFETGDPNLTIERANSLEATLRIERGALRFEGSIYSTWFSHYIYGELTGRTCDDAGVCTTGPGGALKELNYTQQGAHFRGLEGQASYRLLHNDLGTLELKVLGDYVRATLDNGDNVPRIPPYRYGGGVSWSSGKLDADILFIHAGQQDNFGVFDNATPSYNDLGAQVTWRPFTSHPGIEFGIIGQNLTNAVQRDAAALNRDLVVAPGRNVRLLVKLGF